MLMQVQSPPAPPVVCMSLKTSRDAGCEKDFSDTANVTDLLEVARCIIHMQNEQMPALQRAGKWMTYTLSAHSLAARFFVRMLHARCIDAAVVDERTS